MGVIPDSRSFVLDEESPFPISQAVVGVEKPKWICTTHTPVGRQARVLIAGETAWTPSLRLGREFALYLCIGSALPTISADGVVVEVSFEHAGHPERCDAVFTHSILAASDLAAWREFDLDLSFMEGREGRFRIQCLPRPQGDPSFDWLGIHEFIVSRRDARSLLRATAFRASACAMSWHTFPACARMRCTTPMGSRRRLHLPQRRARRTAVPIFLAPGPGDKRVLNDHRALPLRHRWIERDGRCCRFMRIPRERFQYTVADRAPDLPQRNPFSPRFHKGPAELRPHPDFLSGKIPLYTPSLI